MFSYSQQYFEHIEELLLSAIEYTWC